MCYYLYNNLFDKNNNIIIFNFNWRCLLMGLRIYIRNIDTPANVEYCPYEVYSYFKTNKELLCKIFCGTMGQVRENFYEYLHNLFLTEKDPDDEVVCGLMSIFIWLKMTHVSELDYVSTV